jgi:hypothetical protein
MLTPSTVGVIGDRPLQERESAMNEQGRGSEYSDDVRNGQWEYQVIGADREVNEIAHLKACFTCRKPHEKQDFVISLVRLDGNTGQAARPAAGAIEVMQIGR